MEKIVIWGTGEIANRVFNECKTINQYELIGAIDNNACKQGKKFHGLNVYAPDFLLSNIVDKIVVLSNAFDEISRQIILNYPDYKQKVEDKNYFYKCSLIKRYDNTDNKEIIEVLEYLQSHNLSIFNYNFVDKYKNIEIDVQLDKNCNMFFVYHCGLKMFFPRKMSAREDVIRYYRSILVEQDEKSPHRYLSSNFDVAEDSIVVDVGTAEGNFAIEVIDKVKKIYLIEADDGWIEALKMTFADYADKVSIINKYVTSYDEGKFAKLDSIINEKVNFIKMDIEGNEWNALLGAEQLINASNDIKLAICCYHSDFDQILIEDIMDKYNVNHSVTTGYMWFPYTCRQTYVSTQLNKGVVKGYKCLRGK